MSVREWFYAHGATILRDHSGAPCLWIAARRGGGLAVVQDGGSASTLHDESDCDVAALAAAWAAAMDPDMEDADLWRQVEAVRP